MRFKVERSSVVLRAERGDGSARGRSLWKRGRGHLPLQHQSQPGPVRPGKNINRPVFNTLPGGFNTVRHGVYYDHWCTLLCTLLNLSL